MAGLTLAPLEAAILGETLTGAMRREELDELLAPEYSLQQIGAAFRRLSTHGLIRSWGHSRGHNRVYWSCTGLGVTMHANWCAHLDQLRFWEARDAA